MELNVKLQALDLDMPPSWQYSTTLLDHKSDRTFDLHFDSYPDRSVSQIWNFLRLVRILLNESLIEHYLASPIGDKYLALIGVAHDNIETLVGEICACVPQYVDCDGTARHRLPTSEKSEFPDQTPDHILDRGPGGAGHPHTPNHQLECYTLIFPLYVAGRSKSVPDVRPWVIKQLHYISSHFTFAMLKSSLKSLSEKKMSALGKYMPCWAATHSALNGGKPRPCDAQAYENLALMLLVLIGINFRSV
jgi:hypothetical protein